MYNTSYPDVDVTDVEVCGSHVFVCVANNTDQSKGFLDVYRAYNKTTKDLVRVNTIPGNLISTLLVHGDQIKSDLARAKYRLQSSYVDE